MTPPATTSTLEAPRWITYVRLPELTPAVRNPKKHWLSEIESSIQRHGFTTPVLRCDRTLRLAAGHGRCETLVMMRNNGYNGTPQGILVDDDGEWLVPTINGWSSRDDTELEAYIIADNRLTEAGGWDDHMLTDMLHDIVTGDATLLDGIGFTADDLDELLKSTDTDLLDQGPTGDDADPDGQEPAPTRQVGCPHCGGVFPASENTLLGGRSDQ